MEREEFFAMLDRGERVVGGSDAHLVMHEVSQEAIRICAEMNSGYHTPIRAHCSYGGIDRAISA